MPFHLTLWQNIQLQSLVRNLHLMAISLFLWTGSCRWSLTLWWWISTGSADSLVLIRCLICTKPLPETKRINADPDPGHHRVFHHVSLRRIWTGTVETLYNMINFCWSTHKRHSTARPKGPGMGCLLWVQRATYCVDLSILSSIKYLL